VEGLLEDGGRKLLMRLERRGECCFLREVSSESEPPDGLEITLLIGILKADQFDAVLKASSEVGVKSVMPVFCERSVPRIAASDAQKKISRWQKILDEGASVTGSPFHPKITAPKHFDEIDWNALPENRFAAIISSDARPISGAVCGAGGLVYAVGPEGDWSEAERASLLAHAFIPVTLGRRIMRASTAAITGCAWFRFRSG
jgi:16S rRNA (uracil1498-N3)-methyltransferase